LVAITNRLALRNKLSRSHIQMIMVALVEAASVLVLARLAGWWPVAMGVVAAVELWPLRPGAGLGGPERAKRWLGLVPRLLVGLSAVLIIAVSLRAATQVAVAAMLAAARIWWTRSGHEAPAGLIRLLIVQAAVFEAVFLMAAMWRPNNWIVIGLAWLGSYLATYAVLTRRGERAAGVLAAAWGVVVVEVSWVLLLWLFTYTMTGGYVLVPQPALILTAIGYCFGSIYASQREGTLSRGRLTEYLLIGLILVVIVIVGTSWRGTV